MPMDPISSDERVVYETALEHATKSVPVFSPEVRADDGRNLLSKQRYECVSHVVVCVNETFLGVVRMEDLLVAPADATLEYLMDHDSPVVAPGTDQEIAAWRAVRHSESALSVVDKEQHFMGIIPPHRLLAILLSEHEEDLARLGGFIKSTAVARSASEETVQRRFLHRIPWLLVGLGGAMLAADLVGWFEALLRNTIMLAFFIPGIVYLADAVGTQTETVVIRGLSVGNTMKKMVARELMTGLVIGLALALVAGPFIWWRWGEADIALSVGLAIFAACSTATLAAMMIPWVLDTFGLDPAFGSGPLATVIQDLLSILLFFGIAYAVVQ